MNKRKLMIVAAMMILAVLLLSVACFAVTPEEQKKIDDALRAKLAVKSVQPGGGGTSSTNIQQRTSIDFKDMTQAQYQTTLDRMTPDQQKYYLDPINANKFTGYDQRNKALVTSDKTWVKVDSPSTRIETNEDGKVTYYFQNGQSTESTTSPQMYAFVTTNREAIADNEMNYREAGSSTPPGSNMPVPYPASFTITKDGVTRETEFYSDGSSVNKQSSNGKTTEITITNPDKKSTAYTDPKELTSLESLMTAQGTHALPLLQAAEHAGMTITNYAGIDTTTTQPMFVYNYKSAEGADMRTRVTLDSENNRVVETGEADGSWGIKNTAAGYTKSTYAKDTNARIKVETQVMQADGKTVKLETYELANFDPKTGLATLITTGTEKRIHVPVYVDSKTGLVLGERIAENLYVDPLTNNIMYFDPATQQSRQATDDEQKGANAAEIKTARERSGSVWEQGQKINSESAGTSIRRKLSNAFGQPLPLVTWMLPTSQTLQAVQGFFTDLAAGYEQYKGLGDLIVFGYSDEDLAARWKRTNEMFCDTIILGGTQCWQDKICETFQDQNTGGTATFVRTTLGGVYIRAEKGAKFTNSENQSVRLYKVEYRVANPTDYPVKFNIYWDGIPWYGSGSTARDIAAGKAKTMIGASSIVVYKQGDYANACIIFDTEIPITQDEPEDTIKKICQSFVETGGAATTIEAELAGTAPTGGGASGGGAAPSAPDGSLID